MLLSNIVNESNHKPKKLRVDQRTKFYYKLMQEWLKIIII